MATASGLVAVLNEEKNAVKEVRDLGPVPVSIKAGFVLPLVVVRPALGPNQVHGNYTDIIAADKVTRTFTVITLDLNLIDQKTLNDALTAEGSIVRSLGLVLFQAINQQNLVVLDTVNTIRGKLVPPLAAFTVADFKAALAAKGDTAFYTMPEFLAALQAKMRN